MANIEVSPVRRDPNEAPEISFVDFLFERLNTHLPALNDKPWVFDVLTGRSIKYGEIEEQSRRVASALSRLGLRRGDILYFVTYDMSHVYVAMMAAWRLGAAVRGCYQKEEPEEITRQMREGDIKIALLDEETAPRVQKACSDLEWDVKLISLGPEPVKGATSFDELLKDDGTAFPAKVEINPREDVLIILNTSGSTGMPKGAMQTHYSCVSVMYSTKPYFVEARTQLTLSSNFASSNFFSISSTFYTGGTVQIVSKFVQKNFINQLIQCKPESVMLYPYVVTWLARELEFLKHDMSFLKIFGIGGSVLDHSTLKCLQKAFPKTMLLQAYAMSEFSGVSMTLFSMKSPTDPIKTCEFGGTTYVSSGKLFPYAKAKVIDPDSGVILGRMQSGEILVHAPYVMKGYLVHITKPPNRKDIDEEGWYHTGDLGFFDEDGHLYIQERKSFIFKYFMFFVSPSDIEAVLSEHPAVQEVGVVGVPNPETTCLARAMVVLRPAGAQVSASELEVYVSQRLPSHMHLHGGVTFIDKLPASRGGKLDRAALLKIAVNDKPGMLK